MTGTTTPKSTNKTIAGRWILNQARQIAVLYGSKYWPALIKLTRPRPFSADIHVSTKCNSRCISCGYWRRETRYKNPTHDLTTGQVEETLKQLREIGIRVVGLGGAEPLIRKDIGELVKMAKEILGGKVYLTTNGLLLERKAEILIENGIDHISVSIDGIGKTNDKIRGVPGNYEKATKGIKKLRELIEARHNCACVCNIGTTIMRFNAPEIPQLIELAKQLGTHWNFNLLDGNINFAKSVDLSHLFIRNKNAIDDIFNNLEYLADKSPEVFTLDPASLDYARNYLEHQNPYRHCFLGFFRIYIDPHLNVYPGCIVLPPVGNLENNRLSAIVESKLYRQRAEQMYRMECPGCTCGYLHNCMIEELPTTIKYLLKKISIYRKYM